MAARKPLVLSGSGDIQEIQSGDVLDAPVLEVDVYPATNNNVGTISKGQPVYVDGSGSVDLARANALSTSRVVGLVRDASIASAASGDIQTDGILEVADWTTVTGSAALTPGSVYYLDQAAEGQLTTSAPTGNPNTVTRVGIAVTTTGLEITIMRAIERG